MKYISITVVMLIAALPIISRYGHFTYQNHSIAVSRTSYDSEVYKWEQILPFGNGSFQEEWKPGTFPLGIKPIVAFNGNLWMIGQKMAWSSPDGTHWTAHQKKDWGERIYNNFVYFNNKLWLFGGMKYQEKEVLNEIWFSADGINWEQAKNAEWSPRKGHSVVVFKDKLWLLGGASDISSDFIPKKYSKDIWSSKDGLHWTEETKSASWPHRDSPGLVVLRDSLYMLGGEVLADVWRSGDGKNWTKLLDEADWKKRSGNGLLVYDNKMWVFGGNDTTANRNLGAKNDVWFSANGIKWEQQAKHAPWTIRSGGASVVFNNAIWLFSGKHTGGDDNWKGDIWALKKVRAN